MSKVAKGRISVERMQREQARRMLQHVRRRERKRQDTLSSRGNKACRREHEQEHVLEHSGEALATGTAPATVHSACARTAS